MGSVEENIKGVRSDFWIRVLLEMVSSMRGFQMGLWGIMTILI
jgi:hypothetical protein